MTCTSVNKVFSALFSNNSCGPSQSPSKVPTFSGTYVQSYRILRVEKSSQLQDNLTEDFLENYNFDYTVKDITDTSSDVKDNYLVIKQDNENPQFGVIFEDTLQSLIRPIKGIRPCVCIYKTDHWVMISSDYDDNGVYYFKMITNEKNEVIELEGYYNESGYNELGPIQSPTIATVKYVKVSDSLLLVKEPVETRNRQPIDVIKKYLPRQVESSNLDILEKLVDKEGQITVYYNRLQMIETDLPAEDVYELNRVNNAQYSYAKQFVCNLFWKNPEGINWYIGQVYALNGYSIADGVSKCDVEGNYTILPEEHWKPAVQIIASEATESIVLPAAQLQFTTQILPKLAQNKFVLGKTTGTIKVDSELQTRNTNSRLLLPRQLNIEGQADGSAVATWKMVGSPASSNSETDGESLKA